MNQYSQSILTSCKPDSLEWGERIFRGQKTFVPANNALPRKCQEIN